MLRIAVLLAPDTTTDPDCLQRFLDSWSDILAIDAVVSQARTVRELRLLVAEAVADGLIVGGDTSLAFPALVADIVSRGLPAIAVNTSLSATQSTELAAGAWTSTIRGRGIKGYSWALRHLVERNAWQFQTYSYGSRVDQVADLRVPNGEPPFSVVVLLHGGGWAEHWTRDLMDGLSVSLAKDGYASWNLEYRRVGSSRGGWPTTFEDVATGIDALRHVEPSDLLDLDRVIFLGHSAGAQLALWAAAEATQRATPVGPEIRPQLVISLAGVTDLVEAARRGIVGEDVVSPLVGGLPDEVPERYARVSPRALLPIGVRQVLVQGLEDYLADLIDLNASYFAAASLAGDDVELLELVGADHLDVINAHSKHWAAVVARLHEILPP